MKILFTVLPNVTRLNFAKANQGIGIFSEKYYQTEVFLEVNNPKLASGKQRLLSIHIFVNFSFTCRGMIRICHKSFANSFFDSRFYSHMNNNSIEYSICSVLSKKSSFITVFNHPRKRLKCHHRNNKECFRTPSIILSKKYSTTSTAQVYF